MNRREFLKDAAIASAAITAFPSHSAAAWMGKGNSGISAVVYDARYANCRTFAESLEKRGAVAFPTNGDAGQIWYGILRQHLVRFPGSVAGMTTDSDWGLSRGWGREAGLKVAYEGAHDSRKSGSISHVLRGGVSQIVYQALLSDPRSWAASIALALSRPDATGQSSDSAKRAPVVTTLQSYNHPGCLTSWLLQPSGARQHIV